jgi:glycosyltransferase involved in cell wall biosynthesis
MRVLQIIPSVAPARGGPTYVVLHLSRALARRGIAVEVLATRSDLDDQGEAAARQILGDVPLTLVPIVGTPRLELSPSLLPALHRALARTDLVEIHTVFTFPPASAAAWAWRRGVPYVVRPAGTLDSFCIAHRSAWRKRLAVAAYVRPMLRHAAAVRVTSALEEVDVRALEPDAAVERVELGVELDDAGMRPATGRTLGSLGRIHPIKRLEVLLDALALLDGVELEIAGGGEPDYLAGLQARAERLGIAGRVRWLGALDEAGKRAFLERTAVLSFPSAHESFGLAVAEALAAGRAVVVSPEVGLADELQRAQAGLVAPANPVLLAEALRSLLDDAGARARLGSNGRALVAGRFTWEAAADRTLAMYERALRSSAKP